MNNQRWLSISFLTFLKIRGVFLPYWTRWLTLEKGLFVTAARAIMGTGMIARALSTFPYFLIHDTKNVSHLHDEMDVFRITYFSTSLFTKFIFYHPTHHHDSI